MGLRSKIQWLFDPYLDMAGASWNTWWGCRRTEDTTIKLSACTNCYIFRTMPLRTRRLSFDKAGPGGKTPLVYAPRKTLFAPLRWKTPLMVFVESLGDLWYGQVPTWRIAEIYAIMLLTPRHIYLTLTKRTRRQRNWLLQPRFAGMVGEAVARLVAEFPGRIPAADVSAALAHLAQTGPDEPMLPLPNVWCGATVECNDTAALRIPELAATPAAVAWLSVEPITDPDLDLAAALTFPCPKCRGTGRLSDGGDCHYERCADGFRSWFFPDMVVLGGESGPAAKATDLDTEPAPGLRPLDLDHLARLIEQLRGHEPFPPAVFVKQLGEPAAREFGYADRKGGDPAEWPPHLRIRQYPLALARRALRHDPGNRLALEHLGNVTEVAGV